MKKFVLFSAILAIVISSAFVFDNGKNTFENNRYKANFNLKQGMFNGMYTSYYSNGIKRAEGQFLFNMRNGKWSVWDSTGKLLVKREYKNGFEFKQLYPEAGSKTIAPPFYTLTRNESGFYSYFDFKQSDVAISKRVWRDVSNDDESSFFGNDDFYHMLVDSISKGKISIYDFSSDELTQKISGAPLKNLMDTVGKEIIGFKIKEDWFFDKQRKTSERRIVCICPVICKKDTSRLTDDDYSFNMGWLYFPSLRNTLNVLEVPYESYHSNIKTIDDLFFFRYFQSSIYKETNIRNLQISEYCKGAAIEKEANRIEIELIETEHDLWVKYSN